MKPTKQQWKQILTETQAQFRLDKKSQDAWNKLFSVIAPENDLSIIPYAHTSSYLKAIETIYGEDIEENISYYIYDVPDIVAAVGRCDVTLDGHTYNAGNVDEYVEFLVALFSK